MRRAVERFRRDREGRVELVQVPTQPLLGPSALVDEIITMIDEQLQVAKRLLILARTTQTGFPQRCPGDSERVDRIRLATSAAGAPLGCHQLRRHPHQLLADREQFPFERPGQLPAILKRPQPLTAQRRSPGNQRAVRHGDRLLVEHPPRLVDRDSRQRLLVYVHSDHDHSDHAPHHDAGATGERTDLNRGSSQAPIRSRSTVSDGGGDTTLASQPTGDMRE